MADVSGHTKEQNTYPDDYVTAHKTFEARNIDENRFVKFEERDTRTVLTVAMIKTLCHGKYQTNWNGVEVLKSSLDLITMQDLFGREKPATVIEFGSYTGGCALWYADLLKCFGVKSHVYSIDISLDCLHKTAKMREDITFIKADVTKDMEKVFPEKMLKELPHPWFISEDCHVPLEYTLGYLEPFMEPGDYLLVEDTHPSFCAHTGQGLYTPGFDEVGFEKLNDLTEFLKSRSGKFVVDSHYTDFFGYNGSSSMNSYLKRV
ncbi:rhamnosyl O-methyltransferase-like [Paramuricea clavata]|uniref:Rhamnosyl O-methyltransferase-like n=1 Tax=Paramuricea clavata TaxID=317549 RepID=A0A6S7G0M8_PARCT|nr:rhamnosyl O-methyltransferase-like [Paramuricea clavata]